MTTCINLMGSDVWTEEDIVAHGRAVINAQVSSERQQELQTIMLGHIAGMRTATPDELAEIGLVAAITEAQAVANVQARADMALLQSCLDYEASAARLAMLPVTEPEFITVVNEDGTTSEVPNPAIAKDADERSTAEADMAGARQETLDLYALRNPEPQDEGVADAPTNP